MLIQEKLEVHCLLTLEKGEVFRVPQTHRALQVVSGVAWVSLAGGDFILTQGDRLSVPTIKDFALISGLGRIPLVLEVCGESPSPWRSRSLMQTLLKSVLKK